MMPASSMKDVVLFAPMGSNPALLVTMAWALHRRELKVVEAHVVVADRGQRYVDEELLPEGGALSQLHEILGPGVLPRDRLRIDLAKLPDGSAVKEELTGEHERAYQNAVAREAGHTIASAGERPVIFGLIGGRRRSMTIMAGVVAQLLARPEDHVFDLHIEPRGADVPNRFFFPEQSNQESFYVGDIMLKAADVEAKAVPVEIPRLAALLTGKASKPYPELLQAAQKAIDEANPIRLEVSLANGSRGAFVRNKSTDKVEEIDLSDAELLFLASLVKARKVEPDGWVPIPVIEDQKSYFAKIVKAVSWANGCQSHAVQWFVEDAWQKASAKNTTDSLKNLRHETKRKIEGHTKGRDPCYRLLELENTADRPPSWRIPLEDVEIVD